MFLDRDGVINELVPDPVSGLPESPLEPEQVALLPGAATAIRLLHEAGYVVIGVSNQPAAAKGTVSLQQLERVQERVMELLALEGVVPDDFRLCFHHPEGRVAELTRSCDCRKPAPGLLLDAARDLDIDLGSSWMVGDTDGDVAAGEAAGCRTALIENPASAHKRDGQAHPDAHASNLLSAVELLLQAGDAVP